MKPLFIAGWLLFTFELVSAQQPQISSQANRDCEIFPRLLDSVYVYTWDRNYSKWDFNTIWQYESSAGRHDRLFLINAKTRVYKQSWEYSYDQRGNRYYDLSKVWWNNRWDLYLQREAEFNESNQLINQYVSFWKTDTWKLSYSNEYEYFNNLLVKAVNRKVDQAGILKESMYSIYEYNGSKLSTVSDYNSSDGSLIRITRYSYNSDGKVVQLIIEVPDPSFSSDRNLMPSIRHLYNYDELNLLRELYSEEWNGTNWIPSYKYNYFYRIDKAKKVLVCHNGNTICVSVNALAAHLSHGDNLDNCPISGLSDKKEVSIGSQKNHSIPFIVFPNPVKERVTVRFLFPGEFGINRLELLDSKGIPVKSFKVNGENEIVIDRGNLKSGRYLLRVRGDTIFSTILIFN
jgi:hypothetical protein